MIPRPPDLDATQAEQLLQMLLGVIDTHLRTGREARVFDAVTLLNAARLMFVPGFAESPRTHAALGMLLWLRHRRSGSAVDLDAARRFFTHVYPVDPRVLPHELREEFDRQPPAPQALWEAGHALGCALGQEWKRDGGPRLLDHAIMLFGASLLSSPPDGPHRAAIEYNAGVALCSRYNLMRESDDLDAGVAALQRAAQTIADGDRNRDLTWMALGDALATRFVSTRTLADVDAAVAAYRVAGRVASCGLGSALLTRFELTRNTDALNEAIEVLQDAVFRMPPHDPERPAALSALSQARAARDAMR
jgi:hypothetical protein